MPKHLITVFLKSRGFTPLVPTMPFFRPKAHDHRRRWEQRSTGQGRVSPFGPAPYSPRRTGAEPTSPIRLSISILFSLHSSSSTWGRISSPIQRRHSTLFQLRTMALDLEVLILMPGRFTLALFTRLRTDPARAGGHEPMKPTATSSAKSRLPILRSPSGPPQHPGCASKFCL